MTVQLNDNPHRCDTRARRNYEALRDDGWPEWSVFTNSVHDFFGLDVPQPSPMRRGMQGMGSIAEIKARLSIVDVAERLTQLTGHGTLKGRCPLHDDRTPSFVVWQDSGRWRCFGACATGGDVIDLIREATDRGVWR